jgi:hypothetical protein
MEATCSLLAYLSEDARLHLTELTGMQQHAGCPKIYEKFTRSHYTVQQSCLLYAIGATWITGTLQFSEATGLNS